MFLGGDCIHQDVVYGADVTTLDQENIPLQDSTVTYTGGTYLFKKRMYAHNSSFRNVDKRTETTLSEHIWELKDQDLDYILTWKILEKTHAFNPITLQCKLCLSEIYHIIKNPDQASLNRRIEAYNYCRHRKKYLLANARAYEYKAGALILKSVMTRRHGD